MPKLFILRLQVEELALGTVMRGVTAMPGVVKVDLDLDASKSTKAKANGEANGHAGKPRKTFAITGTELLLKAMVKHKGRDPMGHSALMAVFDKAGRAGA